MFVPARTGAYSGRIEGLEAGTYWLRVVQLDSAGARLARTDNVQVTVPCPVDPRIEIVPDSGPPGYTALVEGDGFRPGTIATLTWDDGITAGQQVEVQIGDDGSFEAYLFILPNDWAGERSLMAGLPGEPDAYPAASDVYVVVPGAGTPPGPGGVIVDRR